MCDVPEVQINVMVETISRSSESVEVTFKCNDGFVPTEERVAICNSSNIWYPEPSEHICLATGKDCSVS